MGSFKRAQFTRFRINSKAHCNDGSCESTKLRPPQKQRFLLSPAHYQKRRPPILCVADCRKHPPVDKGQLNREFLARFGQGLRGLSLLDSTLAATQEYFPKKMLTRMLVYRYYIASCEIPLPKVHTNNWLSPLT